MLSDQLNLPLRCSRASAAFLVEFPFFTKLVSCEKY